MSKEGFWSTVEAKGEWVNFEDGIPVDIVIEDPEPEILIIASMGTNTPRVWFRFKDPSFFFQAVTILETLETNWGDAIVLHIIEYPLGENSGGFKRYLKIESKRLRAGIKAASPKGLPLRGYGYRITRRGTGFATTYRVEFTGEFEIQPNGIRHPKDTGQSTLKNDDK